MEHPFFKLRRNSHARSWSCPFAQRKKRSIWMSIIFCQDVSYVSYSLSLINSTELLSAYAITLTQFNAKLQTVGYTLSTSGASCEANGFSRITSLAECQTAPQGMGFSFTKRGTVDTPGGPSGCYHRSDGDLWYNTYGQATAPCDSSSRCVCKTIGKHFHGNANAKNQNWLKKCQNLVLILIELLLSYMYHYTTAPPTPACHFYSVISGQCHLGNFEPLNWETFSISSSETAYYNERKYNKRAMAQ